MFGSLSGKIIDYGTEDQKSPGYLASPKSGKGPGVIVLHEWWGLVDHIRGVCDRLAGEGFFALAPDLFHGQTTDSSDDAGRLMMALRNGQLERDLRRTVRYLIGMDGVSPKKVGSVGFSMGGQLSLFAACTNSDIGACVDFYGNHPHVNPVLENLEAPILGFFGEHDTFILPRDAQKLGEELSGLGKRVDFIIYPDAGHSFFDDTRKEWYNKELAEKSWKKMLKFFTSNLT